MGIVFGLPDLPSVQERLLRNATDLGNCLRHFYGDKIADRYTELIREHLYLCCRISNGKETTKGDATTAAEKEKQWYRTQMKLLIF